MPHVVEPPKKKYCVVCLICAFSDLLLIFLGIFLFDYFNNFFNPIIELVLNILLFIFLLHFIWIKIKEKKNRVKLSLKKKNNNFLKTLYKTLGFTYLNPHVYSDTVFFLGNFS